jgi:phospholipase/carboxylesterase
VSDTATDTDTATATDSATATAFPWLLLSLALLSACSCHPSHREVRWPASHGTTLEQELAVTARSAAPPEGPLPPEPLPADAPGIHAGAFEHAGLWVAEVVLGEVPEDAPLPLVVMLHGRGDRPRIPGGPFGRVPTPMRVLVPRGPLILGEGFAWARHSITQNRHDELAADLIAGADRLASLIAHVRQTRPTAGSPIVTGFSQGAMLAWTLAVRHPQVVGHVIPVAGWVPPAARPVPLISAPAFALHGDDDPIVRIEPTREWVALLRASDNEVTFREYAGVGHEVSPEMNRDFEEHLEALLRARARDLPGGLGAPGPDPEPLRPYDPPLDQDLTEEAHPETAPAPAPAPDSATDPGTESDPVPGTESESETASEPGSATDPVPDSDPASETAPDSAPDPEL